MNNFFIMIRNFCFSTTDSYGSLDEYILANDPQSTHDVERLEREYCNKTFRNQKSVNVHSVN